MLSFLKHLFVGPEVYENKELRPAIKNQIYNLSKVWNDTKEPSFGIERFIRILLVLIQFIFPALYIRHYFGKKGFIARKLAVEFYVILKLIWPVFLMYFDFTHNRILIYITIYFLAGTLFYLLGLIFLSDIYIRPVSVKRSVSLILINYIEVTLDFAIIYRGLDLVEKITSDIEAVYFSFVTSITLGYGDFSPVDSTGMFFVILQTLFYILFIVIILSNFLSKIDEKNFKSKK